MKIADVNAAIALLSHRQVITPGRLLGRTGGTLVLFAGTLVAAIPLLRVHDEAHEKISSQYA
ncbi:hypothetical protein ACTWPT_40160 [Nonomuraea sp. 3N208]|uniref:hypothetical protein n=1 Tax=Nonomuraea sp. 3N208 TaxID=3457421 RepID=UPI003FD2E77D